MSTTPTINIFWPGEYIWEEKEHQTKFVAGLPFFHWNSQHNYGFLINYLLFKLRNKACQRFIQKSVSSSAHLPVSILTSIHHAFVRWYIYTGRMLSNQFQHLSLPFTECQIYLKAVQFSWTYSKSTSSICGIWISWFIRDS